jgi:hypothetical protein
MNPPKDPRLRPLKKALDTVLIDGKHDEVLIDWMPMRGSVELFWKMFVFAPPW